MNRQGDGAQQQSQNNMNPAMTAGDIVTSHTPIETRQVTVMGDNYDERNGSS